MIAGLYNDLSISLGRTRLRAFSTIHRIAIWGLTSLCEAPSGYGWYWIQHRVVHCSCSMGIFAVTLVPFFKSCEKCDYGNKPKDLPFRSRKVTEFHLPLLPVHLL